MMIQLGTMSIVSATQGMLAHSTCNKRQDSGTGTSYILQDPSNAFPKHGCGGEAFDVEISSSTERNYDKETPSSPQRYMTSWHPHLLRGTCQGGTLHFSTEGWKGDILVFSEVLDMEVSSTFERIDNRKTPSSPQRYMTRRHPHLLRVTCRGGP
ncbi:hypothetical protein J6590_019127 [Homalodisca vitripennis]|nr:hypothetical protein J6590_019127 [Homalodisca vitripennis]